MNLGLIFLTLDNHMLAMRYNFYFYHFIKKIERLKNIRNFMHNVIINF